MRKVRIKPFDFIERMTVRMGNTYLSHDTEAVFRQDMKKYCNGTFYVKTERESYKGTVCELDGIEDFSWDNNWLYDLQYKVEWEDKLFEV